MNEVIELLRQLASSAFWGSVEVKLEDGRVTLIRKMQTIVPRDLHNHLANSQRSTRDGKSNY